MLLSTRRPAGGFTLIELMIVVVIIGALAALGTIGFRRWVARARTTEAVTMLAEISSKEQTYRMEAALFLPLRADGNVTLPSPDESAAAFFPIAPNSGAFDSVRTPVTVADSAQWPPSWRTVGVSPRDTALYCTYMANAGEAGQSPPAGGSFGARLVTGTAAPWFYALAACNLSGASGFPDEVAVFGLSSTSPTLRTFNEGR